MALFDNVRKIFNNLLMMDEWLTDSGWRKRAGRIATAQDYYDGNHRTTLAVRPNQADDNLTINLMGLAVERSISLLVGNGIKIEFEQEGTDELQDAVTTILEANKDSILFHKSAQFAAIGGTGYFKLQPDGVEHPELPGTPIVRIIPLNPLYMTIETMDEDVDGVERYIMRFNTVMNGKDTARKEVTERLYAEEEELDGSQKDLIVEKGWVIRNYYANADTQGRWVLMDEVIWEYPFPPILHWQNLPKADDVYGVSDLKDVMALNDRLNFIAANISKIIRYHAHPKTWGRGKGLGAKASWGADELVMLQGDTGMLQNLEMTSDLMSSQQFMLTLRQLIFDISRTVDISSVGDKIGALTNFGLRVLFFDSLAKLATKRELFGEAIRELVRRIIVIQGGMPINCKIVWPEALPIDDTELTTNLQMELGMGIVSKQTASERSGYDWEKEQNRMEKEASSEQSVGELILKSFNQGLGNVGGTGTNPQDEQDATL